MTDPTVLRAARWADVETGQVRSPAVVVVVDERITEINPEGPLPDPATIVDLGDVTLLPGLMDMELNLLIGGPGGPEGLPNPMHGVQDDPAYRTLLGFGFSLVIFSLLVGEHFFHAVGALLAVPVMSIAQACSCT